ncbi:MAG: tyrosine--tRNA ligase [Candidatus Colwellbacteria bacterium]|nr:tyrosine--tRNA ligase [Candidatus Colwellbacteria bacterium]
MKLSKNQNREEEISLIEDLLARSVTEVIPSKEALREALLSGKKLKIYIGTDATGTSLHLGHATNYMVLEKFRKLGHKVIFLIGDFTARIGDPTDKSAARKQLTRAEVKKNVKTWMKQIAPVINLKDRKNPVSVKYNHDWLSKLTFEKLIDLASNFTVQQMLERDMFEKRIKEEKPIYLHEFFYPLMQGYDSVAMDVDIELCGNDQKFNALAGRTLQRKINNKEKFVFITTLLVNPVTGEKMMSKSLGTGVFLDSSPNEMFGKIMAQADENIIQLLTDCTYVPFEEINDIKSDLESGKVNPRDIKAYLAEEIVSIYHGEAAADRAAAEFNRVFREKELPEEMEEVVINNDEMIAVEIAVASGAASSKSEARRLIEQGGLKIGGQKIESADALIEVTDGLVVQAGKKKFVRIRK